MPQPAVFYLVLDQDGQPACSGTVTARFPTPETATALAEARSERDNAPYYVAKVTPMVEIAAEVDVKFNRRPVDPGR